MAKGNPVYILGGAQTDFQRNWSKEGKTFLSIMKAPLLSGSSLSMPWPYIDILISLCSSNKKDKGKI